jgi:hypothetical protein
MALAAGTRLASSQGRRVATLAPAFGALLVLALGLGGCGDTINSGVFDKLAAGPPVPMPARAADVVPQAADMGGRWTLTMPGTGACALTFATGLRQGAIAPETGCPGKFASSRRWDVEAAGLVIRDQSGATLAQLRMPGPGQLEGETADGQQVLLAR